ncbi:type I secretion system permease/ATPase [Stappia sp.]|uniref:type I secretion system permease/ATPase n=1 Tax=Stappia sp. TaxID=1870903 RepID=UPI0032D99DB5
MSTARPGAQDRTSLVSSAFAALRGAVWGTGAMSLVINLLMLTGPLFMLQVYDRVLASGSVPTLAALGGLVVALYMFFGLLEGVRGRLLSRMGQRVDARLSTPAFEVSSRLPLQLGARAEQVRPVQDIDTLRQFVSGPGPAAFFDLPWLPVYLAIVFLFHTLLGFVALAGALVICVLIALNEAFSRKPAAEAAQEAGRRAALVEAGRRNAEAVQAMGMRAALSARWQAANDRFLERQRRASDRAGSFGSAIKAVRFVLQSAVLGVGAWLAIDQEITPGVMIAASILTSRALAPVEQAVAQWRGFVAARQSLGRLRGLLVDAPDTDTRLALPAPEQNLRIEGLAAAPAGLTTPVVQGVSFALSAGDGLGVIGPSGSGKSTLARAIVGVVPALKGALRLDGAELSQWSDEQIAGFVGYLPQDIQLFEGTIAENIARFDPDARDEDVIAAAKLADVHELIVSLPEGYNMQIGAAGLTLSGGQRQRIALARALYRSPFLVVLDEPNSNLDAQGEAALTRAVSAMRARGSIVIVIAHRPSAIAAVDTLLYLQDGRMAAFGPKTEVMKKTIAPAASSGSAGHGGG